MSNRIKFTTWGRKASELNFASYAVCQEHETPIEAVSRSIERSTGLTICAGPRNDGTAMENNEPVANHYQLALGTPCRGGGYSPEAEVWVSVPVDV